MKGEDYTSLATMIMYLVTANCSARVSCLEIQVFFHRAHFTNYHVSESYNLGSEWDSIHAFSWHQGTDTGKSGVQPVRGREV